MIKVDGKHGTYHLWWEGSQHFSNDELTIEVACLSAEAISDSFGCKFFSV